MRQTIKIGLAILVTAFLTMSGTALAQKGEDAGEEEGTARGFESIFERLGPLVESGAITRAQAEQVAETLAEALGPHRMMHGIREAAEFLGMDVEDLAEQLRGGATLAEIAGDRADELTDHLVADVEEHLARAVADGMLTQAEADERLAEAEERITAHVDEGRPERPEDGLFEPDRPRHGLGESALDPAGGSTTAGASLGA